MSLYNRCFSLRFCNRTLLKNATRINGKLGASFLHERNVMTSTVDWEPIKTHHSPNDKGKKEGSFGKKIVLGLMFAMPVISFYLGTWQLRRLSWKTRLIAQCESKLTYDPIPLPKDFQVDMCEDWEYRRVKIRGHFLHEEEVFVGPRAKNGEKGYILYTPFVRNDTGEKLLVERGWISEEKVSPDSRTLHHLSLPDAQDMEIVCLVRPPKERGQFQWAKTDRGSRLWQVADIYDIADSIGCKPINFQALYDLRNHSEWITKSENDSGSKSPPFWKFWEKKPEVQAVQKSDGLDDIGKTSDLEFNEFQFIKAGVPIGRRPTIDLRNNHLQYLVTWYGLSFLSTIFLVIALKKFWRGSVISQAQLRKDKLKQAQKYM